MKKSLSFKNVNFKKLNLKNQILSHAIRVGLVGLMCQSTTYALAQKEITPSLPSSPAQVIAQQAPFKPIDMNGVTTQLPTHVQPYHYQIHLTPQMDAKRFIGQADIHLAVLQATSNIVLQATDLKFKQVRLLNLDGSEWAIASKINPSKDKQSVDIQFTKSIAQGQYLLETQYEGLINEQASGIFSLDYEMPDGKKKALYTQFENSDARRVFPSWDEPIYKATFDLKVTAPKGMKVVSNMPVMQVTSINDKQDQFIFERTPKMSTYLLFLSMGEFERATAQADGVEIGVVTKRGSMDKAQYILQESPKILKELNQYFGLPYPLKKLDNIAAPGSSQFFSAMENWGAIFTFESSILFDPKTTTQNAKKNAFITAAHETAHQWFGNLVTMKWWDDLWLNEGFASWMENEITAKIHPEWDTAYISLDVKQNAMAVDALSTSHPVVQKIVTVEQASQAFDNITYLKGQSVITMLEDYVGKEKFQKGVQNYMKKYAYQNTSTKDFFTEIEKAAGQPIMAIAQDFTYQPGVPLVVVKDASCQDGRLKLKLEIDEFTSDRPHKKPLSWHVPLSIQSLGHEKINRILASEKDKQVDLETCATPIVNAGQKSYFRTLYRGEALRLLQQDFNRVPALDQVGILKDMWALSSAGVQNYEVYLNISRKISPEASAYVWQDVLSRYAAIDDNLKKNKHQAKFREFVLNKIKTLQERLGAQAQADENDAVKDLRHQIKGMLTTMQDAKTLRDIQTHFDWIVTNDARAQNLSPEDKNMALSVSAYNANKDAWDKLHTLAKNEKDSVLKSHYYALLGYTENKALAQRALELALSNEPTVTTSPQMIAAVAGNFPEMAFDFSMKNFDKVSERLDATSRTRYFAELVRYTDNKKLIDKLNQYAKKRLDQTSRAEVDKSIAAIQSRVQYKKNQLPQLLQWVEKL